MASFRRVLFVANVLICAVFATTTGLPYSVKNATLPNGVDVFYREAGDPSASTILLLHGFPSSSHHYRNLIPILAQNYRVLAPDYPGFGFTQVPDSLNFNYTFEEITSTIASFLDVLNVTTFTPYLFDYGAAVGLRLALQRPQAINAIISQNGNAYVEGLGRSFWTPIFALWNATTPEEISSAAAPINATALDLAGVKSYYVIGSQDPNIIEPESYWLDSALLDRSGNRDIQLAISRDYRTNVQLYPQFQQYFRNQKPALLAAWGKNDIVFVPAGAEAFKRDLPSAEVHFIDAGHFLLETNLADFVALAMPFLQKNLK